MSRKQMLKRKASDSERLRETCAKAKRVLLCMTDQHIGNFAVSTAALRALQRGFAQSAKRADVIVARGFVPLAERLLDPTTILAHDMPKTFRGDLAGLRRTRKLTRGRYDLLVGMSGGIRGSTLARFAGVRTTVGLDRYRRSGLYSLRIADHDPAHALGRYAQFCNALVGIEPVIEPARALGSDGSMIRAMLENAGIDPDAPLTVLHAGAGKPNRRWPVERFGQAADHAIESHGHAVGVLTPPGEEPITEGLLASMRHADRARALSAPLASLLPLFWHAEQLVCNESGPMHLAAMTDCAIVALFGPTDPKKWSPIRTGPDVAVIRAGDRTDAIETGAVIRAMDRALSVSAAPAEPTNA